MHNCLRYVSIVNFKAEFDFNKYNGILLTNCHDSFVADFRASLWSAMMYHLLSQVILCMSFI